MGTIVNKKDFEDGRVFYLYLRNFILDRSGRCNLGITDDIEWAAKQSVPHKIWKIRLEEIELEEVTEEIQIKNKVVKPNAT